MKARFLIIAILAMAACQRVELDDPTAPEVITSDADSVCTLTLRASMNESQTKALDLVNDGTRINAYWRNTEKVKVYKGGTFLGTLNVVPDAGERPTQATLSGSITITGLAAGDKLTLRIPRENWDYTGQTGTLESISNAYSYATASVTIDSVDNTGHTVITTDTAHFQNQQSIYRFEFKRKGNVQIQTRALTVMAANGKLVQRVSYEGGVWTPVYGAVQIEKADPSTITNLVSLRNESTSEDRYSFFIIDNYSHILYKATKTIPAYVLDEPGKFISAKNIEATDLALKPITESPGENPTIY